ncbi:MAG: TIGR02921 family PEP-CTERM protein [Anaerolineales bacterium]|nr:TIGR02921 family PEP-CTERM protein [Anaerolineales bacterium]
MNAKVSKWRNRRNWAYGLFWSWNVIFLAFMFLGFAPTVLPEMLTAVRAGDVPSGFVVYAIVLTLIPALTVLLGLTWLRGDAERLFALGYGVEGPLMLILALRFLVIRQATPAVTLLLAAAAVGTLAFLWHLLDRRIDTRHPLLAHLRLIGLTLLLAVGLYASVWIAFYALPVGVGAVQSAGEFVQEMWRELTTISWARVEWRMVPFTVLGMILLLFSGALFVLMPVVVSVLYVRAWWRGVQALAAQVSRPRVAGLTTAVLVLLVVAFTQLSRQPQHAAFALLAEPPQDVAQAQALLAEEETIRAGLLNAYLAPQRYVGAVGEMWHVRELYEWGLNLTSAQARRVQGWYEVVASPVLYQPIEPVDVERTPWDRRALRTEPALAAEQYQAFFDASILDGEHDAIVRAVRSTAAVEQARANWLAVDDREIHLLRQEVTVAEQGDWAEVELYEVYQNQTTLRQEVVYYFSLPETAVVTGVWLGNSADRGARFAYQVAPRGAAQATYRNEVRRNLDPALLEQLGPSQYRLRVFPIEPQIWDWDPEARESTVEDGPPLHLWLTYRVLGTEAGWPLPYLAEKRNVYWDGDSARLLNGAPLAADDETWLPETAPLSRPLRPAAHRVDLPNGQAVLAEPAAMAGAPAPTGDLRLAVVLDRSRSMAALADETAAALDEIGAWGTAVDVYLTAAAVRGEAASRTTLAALDLDGLMYYGGQNAAELLAQFAALWQGEAYDAIFVLTDGTGYTTGESAVAVPMPAAPVWMVHLDGRFPIGYDDDTLTAIQGSGGGAVGSVAEGLARLQASRAAETADVIDGYVWRVVDAGETAVAGGSRVTHAADDPFAAFAARRLILAEMVAQRGRLAEVGMLDELHAIALEYGIVTPYSSMIVLVNQRQEDLLKELSERDDRFEREFEDVGETTPENALTVTGVPEPEEWLLLGLAAAMLGWYWFTNRRGENRTRIAAD